MSSTICGVRQSSNGDARIDPLLKIDDCLGAVTIDRGVNIRVRWGKKTAKLETKGPGVTTKKQQERSADIRLNALREGGEFLDLDQDDVQ